MLLRTVMDDELEFLDMTRITNYDALIGGMEREDYLVLVGGDGTLNRFINATANMRIAQDILYLPAGSGNDFAKDMQKESPARPFSIREQLQNLPSVEVKGKTYRFLNGVGFGIDGYCCQVGDEIKKTPGKKVDYTGIAIKGLLFHFAPRNAKLTVDGREYTYEKVWIAPTMFGRHYGGGMIPTPAQSRDAEPKKLSLMVFHDSSKLKTLMIFPSIFKGEHVKNTKYVEVIEGREITVRFDAPTSLQIDGETHLSITEYTAKI